MGILNTVSPRKLKQKIDRTVNNSCINFILAIYSNRIGIVSNFLMRPVFTPIMEASGLSLYDREVKDHVVQFILGGLRARLSSAVDKNSTKKGEFS